MTENTEKLFGVILDVFLPRFFMGNPSAIFVFLQVAIFPRSAFHLFCCEQLKSCRATHRVTGRATHKCICANVSQTSMKCV